MQTIGVRIRSLRKRSKLTQESLGKLIGVSGVTVLKWEKDENVPKHESLVLLAKHLDTTINYILYDETQELDSSSKSAALVRKIERLSANGKLTNEHLNVLESMIDSWINQTPESTIEPKKMA